MMLETHIDLNHICPKLTASLLSPFDGSIYHHLRPENGLFEPRKLRLNLAWDIRKEVNQPRGDAKCR